MAVVSCKELDLKGTRSWRVALLEGTTCRRTFQIFTDSSADTENDVFHGAQSVGPDNLPSPLTFFPGSSISRAYQYDVSRDKLSSKEWIVTVDHKTIFNQQELDRNANVDPTQRPTRISGASRTIMIPVRACLRAGPYNTYPASPSFTMALARNSANDPLDPPIEVASTEWEIHCEKNVGSLPSWILTYGNGVNTADQVVTIMGTPVTIPKGCGKLSNLTFSDRKQENDIDFITLTWNVTVRVPRQKFATESQVPSPWDEERLDEGTKSYNTSTNAWDNFVDSNKHTTITTPIPLDGTGVPINTSGSPIAETAFQRYCYRPFPQVSYSVIPWA